MGTKERKERERHEMRGIILSSAMKLFVEQGYDNVTIRNIADRIEYSPATIYLYFKDKDEIFFELQNQCFDKFNQEQLRIQSITDPIERLTAHGKAYIEFAINNPVCYDLMFISRLPMKVKNCENRRRSGNRTYDLVKLNIKQCIDAGYFKNADLEIAAFSLWSFVHGIASLHIRDRLGNIPKEHLDSLIVNALEFLKRTY